MIVDLPTPEGQEQLLIRAACRLRESGLDESFAKSGYDGIVDRLPNRRISDTRAEWIWADSAKVVDPGIGNPFGDPHDFSAWREAPAPAWIVPGLLQRGTVTLVSAKGGAGKSLLTLALCVRLAAGGGGRLLAWDLPSAKVPTVLLDAECGSLRLDRRMRELVMGGEFPADVLDRSTPDLYPHTAEALRKRGIILARLDDLLDRTPDAQVVVVDPLRSFLPDEVEDENANLSVGRVIDNLVGLSKRRNVAILILDHDSKDGRAARGASAKRDAAEIVWHLTAPDEDDPSYLECLPDKRRDPGGPDRFAWRKAGWQTDEGLFPVKLELTDLRDLKTQPSARADEKAGRMLSIVQATKDHYRSTGCGISSGNLQAASGIPRRTFSRDLSSALLSGLLIQPHPRGLIYPSDAQVTP